MLEAQYISVYILLQTSTTEEMSMEYYAIYEITGIGSKELIGYVAPAQSSIDRLADNAESVPAISPEVAAGKLGRMLANNQPWTVLKNDTKLVGSSFGSAGLHDDFYNESCIDNYQILKVSGWKTGRNEPETSHCC